MVMLSDAEIKHIYAEAYRLGRVACKRNYPYDNPYSMGSYEHTAWAMGWGDYQKEHKKELFNGKEEKASNSS